MESEVKERKFTTVHDRYLVSDSCCGFVESETSLKRALALAERHAKRHQSDPADTVAQIEVFDRMARRDCVTTWTVAVERAS